MSINPAYRVLIDGHSADARTMEKIFGISVEQEINLCTEAKIALIATADSNGTWTDPSEDSFGIGKRIRIEIQNGDDFIPLIDGPIIGHEYEPRPGSTGAPLSAIVRDDSIYLDAQENAEVFEGKSDEDIARDLLSRCSQIGSVEVRTGTRFSTGGTQRVRVRRGSPLSFLRKLAREYGGHVYVRPGQSAGKSIATFGTPDWDAAPLPALVCMGADRNVTELRIDLDSGKPAEFFSWSLDDQSKEAQEHRAPPFRDHQLGDSPAGKNFNPRKSWVPSTCPPGFSAEGIAGAASYAIRIAGQADAARYSGVIVPYRTLPLMVAAAQWNGLYLVQQVSHSIDRTGYQQKFSLVRNATAAAGALGGVGSAITAAAGGIF